MQGSIFKNKYIKVAFFFFLLLILLLGVYLDFILDVDSYYFTEDYLKVKDKMRISGILSAVFYGILVAIFSIFRSLDNKKPKLFLLNVIIYTLITFTYFVDVNTNIFCYLNMKGDNGSIITSTSEIIATNKDDEFGHTHYYIVGVGIREENLNAYYFKLNHEILKQHYFKIQKEKDTIQVKIYKGQYGYYHSPEIVE